MSNEPKQRMQVVSKTEYIGYLGVKLGGNVIGAFLLLGGLGIVVLSAWGFQSVIDVNIMEQDEVKGVMPPISLMVGAGLFFAVWSIALIWAGRKVLKDTSHMERVQPFTRQTASQLPPDKTLVRASSEPSLPQEKVLLRAAGPGQETPAEELLRASKREIRTPEA